MAAGTIKLTNNSTAVTGTGTTFTTDLKAKDFIVSVVGGITYTLGVQSVESDTALTLITAYGGATTSGLSWTAIPNATLVGITAQVAADVAKAIRGLNLDKANWQQVYSSSGSITVSLPDGSAFTGPSWNYIVSSFSSKLDKGSNLSDVASAATARSNLGLKGASILNVGTAAGTVAAGNDGRLSTIDGKSGGKLTSGVVVDNVTSEGSNRVSTGMLIKAADSNYDVNLQYYLSSGAYHCFRIVQNSTETFQARGNGACYAASFNPTSDARLKLNKERITDALSKVKTLSGYTFDLFGERKAGGLAQEIQTVLPEVITETFQNRTLPDGTVVENTLAVDYGATFGLIVEAIKELSEKVDAQAEIIRILQAVNS